MRPHLRSRATLAALVCLPVLAGCGSAGAGGGSDDPDPAKAIPGSALVYVEGTYRPEGKQADAVEALSKKVANIDDPGERIVQYLESQNGKGEDVSYEQDIKPWIGRRIGFGVTGNTEESLSFVAAAGVSDADKAKDFVADQSKGDKKGSYEGVTYYDDQDEDTIVGVSGDYLVLADKLPNFQAAIDQIAKDDGSMADSKAFDDAVDDLPDDRLATLFVNGERFKQLVLQDPDLRGSGGSAIVEKAFGGLRGISGALTAAEDKAVVETRVVTDGKASTLGLFGPGVAPALVREAPADSLFVYGAKDVGGTYKTAFDEFAGALGGAALRGQLQSGLGIDLDRDVFSWIGDTVVFGRGTGLQSFDGAVMIDAKDADAAATAIPRLIGLARQQGGVAFDPLSLGGADQAYQARIPGAPEPLFVARKGTRVVIALGEDAARAGLQPSSTLDANGAYDRAKQATAGLDPSLIVDVQRVVDIAEQAAAGDEDFARAKPYLEAFTLLVAGAKRDGDTLVSRVALGVE